MADWQNEKREAEAIADRLGCTVRSVGGGWMAAEIRGRTIKAHGWRWLARRLSEIERRNHAETR
jgi:hypothetical protein